MAVSKTISANGSKGHHYFSLNVTESYTSGNSSYMSGSFSLGPLQSGWDWNNWGDRISYSFNVGSNQFTGSIPRYDGSSVLYLQTFNNIEIPHESNGKKTIDISFSVTDTTGANYTSGNASASDTMVLTELHKAPAITQFGIIENNQTLVSRGITNQLVNRASNKTIEMQQEYITLYDNATISKIEVFGENFKFEFAGDQTFLPCNFYNIDLIYHETTAYGDEYKYETMLGVRITDSLGGVGEVISYYPFIYYQPPNIVETQSSVKRNGQLTGKANLNLLANFTNSKIGNAQNVISSFLLKYWEIDATEPDAYNIEIPSSAYTIDNNTISIYNWGISNNGVEITDLDKSKAYYFKIAIRDSINNSYDITLLCSKGVWLMAKFKDRVDFQKITINNNPVSDTSFCCMVTNFEYKTITSGEVITGWDGVTNIGDYSYDTSQNGMIIKNTSVLELTGKIAGLGHASAEWYIYEVDGETLTNTSFDVDNKVVYQFAGNGYMSAPLANTITNLDSTKTYMIKLYVSPYNTTEFQLNNGFGAKGTFICAKKIL